MYMKNYKLNTTMFLICLILDITPPFLIIVASIKFPIQSLPPKYLLSQWLISYAQSQKKLEPTKYIIINTKYLLTVNLG